MEVQLDDPRVGLPQSMDMPFALIGRTEDPTGLDYVDIDFDVCLELCVDHLWDLGHRAIALISGDQQVPSFERYGPYVELAASLPVELDASLPVELAASLAVEVATTGL